MADFKPVVLVHPDGREHTANTAVEYVNLVFGAGYRPKESPKTSTPKKVEG